ncbi:DUF6461 domain-containing protein [Micromonospora fluostatini]|uniref:DUF6461 domain-containing protein n=1 Tax=Micromonospora sp. JCM 30529 TaxID=3421643 RepID=UPI003D17AB6B
MTHGPVAVSDDVAAFVAATMPVFRERIPAAPARLLGRLAAPEEADRLSPGQHWPHRRPDGESECLAAVRAVGALPVERLLGALELTVAGHDWSSAPVATPGLRPPTGVGGAWLVAGGHDSEATSVVRMLDGLFPGLADRTVTVVRAAAHHPAVAPLLAVTPTAADEQSVAAGHGAAHLALAVAVAGAVVQQADPPAVVERAVAIVGLGIGAAALLLREVPLPPAYAAALRERLRAEYLLPAHSSGKLVVTGHRFGLAEQGLPDEADFSGNGLVAVADGGVVVRTGVGQGTVRVALAVLAEAPDAVESHWDEVVEVSRRAAEGHAAVVAPGGTTGRALRLRTPPWPGEYRVRVHARGRDDPDAGLEAYHLVVWAAPAAPEIVHARADRLGYRLRGEPEPARPPEHAYRWVRHSEIAEAATVTVVTGATVEQVLRAFGADPQRPERIDDIGRDLSLRQVVEPWITVLDLDGAVLVVEGNGFRGTDARVLRAASSAGRAASMFWNVNADTQLGFAEAGDLLAAFEPWGGETGPPAVGAALAGLDFTAPRDRIEKGLVAVERFTGRGMTASDLTRIRTANIGFRVTG